MWWPALAPRPRLAEAPLWGSPSAVELLSRSVRGPVLRLPLVRVGYLLAPVPLTVGWLLAL